MDNFIEQVEQYRDEFYRYVLRTLWDPGMAEDVFSSAVLAAWENKQKFTPGTNFRAWMYRILTNKCYVANRVTSRTPAPIDEIPESAFVSLTDDRGYYDVLENPKAVLEACGDEVNKAMERLSQAQRMCLLLRGVEKFSYKEIAEIMEIPVGTVMTHLSRGRAKLRKELLDYAREQGIVRNLPRIIPRDEPADAALERNGTEQ